MIRLREVEHGAHEVYDESGTLLAIVIGDHHHYLRGMLFPDVDGSMWKWTAEGHFIKAKSK